MTRANLQTSHLTASVVLQKHHMRTGAALDALLTEGLAVLSKAIAVLTNSAPFDGAYEVEVMVQENLIILKGSVMASQVTASRPQVNLSKEEMQALFEISA